MFFNNDEFELPEEVQQAVEEEVQQNETRAEAMRRIEEGNLWMTLIDGNVFTAGSARPDILNEVNAKLRKFAEEELNELLGMQGSTRSKAAAASQFDDDQAQALKMIADKVLKRDTSTPVTLAKPVPKMAQFSAPTAAPQPRIQSPGAQQAQAPQAKKQAQPPKKGGKPGPRKIGGQVVPPNAKKMTMDGQSLMQAGAIKPAGANMTGDSNGAVGGILSQLITSESNGSIMSQMPASSGSDDFDINGAM